MALASLGSSYPTGKTSIFLTCIQDSYSAMRILFSENLSPGQNSDHDNAAVHVERGSCNPGHFLTAQVDDGLSDLNGLCQPLERNRLDVVFQPTMPHREHGRIDAT